MRVVAGVLAASLLLLGGLGGVLLLRSGGDDDDERAVARRRERIEERREEDRPTKEAGTGGDEPEVTGIEDLDAVVAELSSFVEEERQLDFDQVVAVELLPDAEFRERLQADAEVELEDVRTAQGVLGALHLLDPDVDLAIALEELVGEGVIGFYDPAADELVVRGDDITAAVRSTLVHELTHALDDQRFELDRPALRDAEDESADGFDALVEGNAVSVEDAYVESLTTEERAALRAEQAEQAAGFDISAIPPVLLALFGFPYSAGPLLIEALLEEGGEERVDAAFAAPPTTTEQVLDPGAYLEGEGAIAVPVPAADGPVVDEGSYGQLALGLTLAQEVGSTASNDASTGWGGDRYVAWEDGDRTCVRTTFVMDTPKDLDELVVAFADWAEGHGDADVVEEAEQLTVTACG